MALTQKISKFLGRDKEPSPKPEPTANASAVENDDDSASIPAPGDTDATGAEATLRERIVAALKTVYDPEIPVDIYELGLIYDLDLRDESMAFIKMTLTSPMCPVAEILPQEVEEKVRGIEGVEAVTLELVWDPPWNPDMMSEGAKLTLNF